jgi:hypothetical protein
MATETAPVNGLYGTNHYAQPAELAASTPPAPTHAPSASQSTTNSATTQQQKADPQEIGWYFVEQYYTTLSKTPEKIHLFYSKKSQLVSGVEAEKVVPALGTKVSTSPARISTDSANVHFQAISEKIKSLDFQDCKVRVLNVDSQASFTNIVVQVIGEMSNKSEPHHKFVQTFVLAEQPNGYFVLNDIFRYLNDDEDEIVEDEQPQPEVPAEEAPTPADGPASSQPHVEDQVVTEDAALEVNEKLEEEVPAEAENTPADVNGDDAEGEPEQEADTQEDASADEAVEEPATEEAAPAQPAEPEPTSTSTESAQETPVPAPAPASDAPPAKKTWASMLGGGTQKPAVPALPISAPAPVKTARPAQPAPAAKAAAEPTSATTPAGSSPPTSQSNGWQTAEHSKKSNRPQNRAVSEGTTLAYIKNVNEKVDARILKEVLENFGELKYFDVSRARVSNATIDAE